MEVRRAEPCQASGAKHANRVVWEFSVRDGFKPFDADCQMSVERGYRAYAAGGSRTTRVAASGHVVLIDFASMRQRVEGSSRERAVRRSVVPVA